MSVLSIPRQVALLVSVAAALCSVACSGGADHPTYTGTDTDLNAGNEVAQPLRCESGSVQECSIFLGRHGDLTNCVPGLDVCSDGAWTGCIDESTLSSDPALYAELVGE